MRGYQFINMRHKHSCLPVQMHTCWHPTGKVLLALRCRRAGIA